jgi:hypothetical protein
MSKKIEIGTVVSYTKDSPRNKALKFHGKVKEFGEESNGIEKVDGVWVEPLVNADGWVWIPVTEVTSV